MAADVPSHRALHQAVRETASSWTHIERDLEGFTWSLDVNDEQQKGTHHRLHTDPIERRDVM
jgi:hypothetical protein